MSNVLYVYFFYRMKCQPSLLDSTISIKIVYVISRQSQNARSEKSTFLYPYFILKFILLSNAFRFDPFVCFLK